VQHRTQHPVGVLAILVAKFRGDLLQPDVRLFDAVLNDARVGFSHVGLLAGRQ
jgi:hypothetical protein